MQKILTVIAFTAALAALPGTGSAKGCLKGAAVGAVAGHIAGHHAIAGAAAGCVIGHHEAHVKDKEAKQRAAAAADKPGSSDSAGTTAHP
jgi:hypothetical protein